MNLIVSFLERLTLVLDRLLFLLLFSFIISEDTYYGGWPKNKDIKSSEIKTVNCPGNLGCECNTDSDCFNDNCQKDLKGKYCSLNVLKSNLYSYR